MITIDGGTGISYIMELESAPKMMLMMLLQVGSYNDELYVELIPQLILTI